jgi:pimeloyl-ACP methyl ester carboxylesterase
MMRAALVVALFVTSCGGTKPAPAPDPAPAPAPVPAVASHPPPAPAFVPASFVARVSGTGRPVIFIPGLGCPALVWDDTVAHLGAGIQAHVLQLAGFSGQAAMKSDAPLAATVRDELAHYIRDRKLDHPVIVGHSMGGFIAMWLAAEEPDLVGPIVVLDAGAAITGVDEQGARAARDQVLSSSEADFAKGTRAMFGTMFGDAKRAEPVIVEVLKSDRKAFANALYELFTTDIRPELPKITAPVLELVADGPYADDLQKQHAAIPHHDEKLLPHTHHFVMYDDPKATFAAIDAFLAAHPK